MLIELDVQNTVLFVIVIAYSPRAHIGRYMSLCVCGGHVRVVSVCLYVCVLKITRIQIVYGCENVSWSEYSRQLKRNPHLQSVYLTHTLSLSRKICM